MTSVVWPWTQLLTSLNLRSHLWKSDTGIPPQWSATGECLPACLTHGRCSLCLLDWSQLLRQNRSVPVLRRLELMGITARQGVLIRDRNRAWGNPTCIGQSRSKEWKLERHQKEPQKTHLWIGFLPRLQQMKQYFPYSPSKCNVR